MFDIEGAGAMLLLPAQFATAAASSTNDVKKKTDQRASTTMTDACPCLMYRRDTSTIKLNIR
jgi:hypothetical protein